MKDSSGIYTHGSSELEYQRKWLHQLQAEFRQICSWYNLSLAAPAFRINNSCRTLGSWDPERREVSISETLISEYSWDAVINILKHEMAHQYVHECMGRGTELAHGPAFREACEKLGVAYPFNTATGDTPKVFFAAQQNDSAAKYNRQVDKVRKMLSLAGSTNRHEAETAMSKANRFIRKYNLERLDSVEPSEYTYKVINTGKKRLHVIERRIASLLMDYFYVDIIYSELFDPASLESYKTIELLGSLENVAFAGHVYDFLRHRVESLWLHYRKSARSAGRLRKTYILGLLQGFREKLEKEEKKQPFSAAISKVRDRHKTISALIVARDPGLSKYIKQRFPRLRKVQYRASSISCAATYAAGKTDGRKITIHKPVKYEDGNLGRLLTS